MSCCRSDKCDQGDLPCPTPETCNAPDWFDRLLARLRTKQSDGGATFCDGKPARVIDWPAVGIWGAVIACFTAVLALSLYRP